MGDFEPMTTCMMTPHGNDPKSSDFRANKVRQSMSRYMSRIVEIRFVDLQSLNVTKDITYSVY